MFQKTTISRMPDLKSRSGTLRTMAEEAGRHREDLGVVEEVVVPFKEEVFFKVEAVEVFFKAEVATMHPP